jgi:hypothetical protein
MSTYPNDVIYSGSSWNGFATSATPTPAPVIVPFSFPISLPSQDANLPADPNNPAAGQLFGSTTASTFSASSTTTAA